MLLKDAPAGSPSAAPKCCLRCSEEFHPRRKDQKYCTKVCAKAATRNAARGTRTSEQKRMNAIHYSRALEQAEKLYTAPICERLGVVKEIVDQAASHDSDLRRILTDPKLLRAKPEDTHLFHRRAPGSYRTISQAANAYTQKFLGVSIQTYLKDARAGNTREDQEVSRSAACEAVPKLSKVKRARCWHRPLPEGRKLSDEERFRADMDHVDRVISGLQATIAERPVAAV